MLRKRDPIEHALIQILFSLSPYHLSHDSKHRYTIMNSTSRTQCSWKEMWSPDQITCACGEISILVSFFSIVDLSSANISTIHLPFLFLAFATYSSVAEPPGRLLTPRYRPIEAGRRQCDPQPRIAVNTERSCTAGLTSQNPDWSVAEFTQAPPLRTIRFLFDRRSLRWIILGILALGSPSPTLVERSRWARWEVREFDQFTHAHT